MEEKRKNMIWYCLRWPGLVCLCSLVFLFGLHIDRQESITASGIPDGIRIPVCSVQTNEKKVALTFDVAGEKEDTQKILDILAAHQIQAAFFVTGEWAKTHPEEIQGIAAGGHDIGSSGESRKDMSVLSENEIKESLAAAYEEVKTLINIDMKLFRPPYGKYSNTLIETADRSGYMTVLWNVDSEDWKDYGAQSILRTVAENEKLENGSVILMHSEAKYTAEALEAVINSLQEQEYELVPVSRLIVWEGYQLDAEGRQVVD